jgi:hypothetical protein
MLKQELNNLKKSEATIVILKDRADKSEVIFDSDITRNSVESFNILKNQSPEGIIYTDVNFENNEALISFDAIDSRILASFITNLISSGIYGKIFLSR